MQILLHTVFCLLVHVYLNYNIHFGPLEFKKHSSEHGKVVYISTKIHRTVGC